MNLLKYVFYPHFKIDLSKNNCKNLKKKVIIKLKHKSTHYKTIPHNPTLNTIVNVSLTEPTHP